jgi:hypothetical protein
LITGLRIEGLDAVDRLQQLILFLEGALKTFPQPCFIQQVDHTDAAALGFIGIGGSDAAASGADPPVAALLLHRQIQQAVIRHGHVGRGGQLQAGDIDVIRDEHVQLTEHHLGIHDRA